MHVSFANKQLELIETHRAGETALPVPVISLARNRLSILRASPDFGTLLSWRSFGLAQDAILPGRHEVSVSGNWKMAIAFEDGNEPRSIILAVNEMALSRGRVE